MNKVVGPTERYECLRCGHVWAPGEQAPRSCPMCGHLFLDTPMIRLVQKKRARGSTGKPPE